MIWWVIRFVMLASIGWFANTALDTYQESRANKAAAEKAIVEKIEAAEQALIREAQLKGEALRREQILSDALEARQAELIWARDQKENDELIKEQLRSENAELDKALRLIIDPQLAP